MIKVANLGLNVIFYRLDVTNKGLGRKKHQIKGVFALKSALLSLLPV